MFSYLKITLKTYVKNISFLHAYITHKHFFMVPWSLYAMIGNMSKFSLMSDELNTKTATGSVLLKTVF